MGLPHVSIIVPNRNDGRFLERAVCSVLDQGYGNLQLIVVDGGSTDDSQSILSRYPEAAPLTVATSGRSAAINHGLARAEGEIIGILNSNDVYLPGAIETVIRRMNDGIAAWCIGQAIRINAADEFLGRVSARAPASLAAYLMRNSGFLPVGASFWHRNLLTVHGQFDASLHFAADYEYACRLLSAAVEPVVLPQPLVGIREHAESRSAAGTLRQGWEYIAAAQRYGDRLKLPQRAALGENLACRRRIYTLAQAEMNNAKPRAA